jgi:hypothetical protein
MVKLLSVTAKLPSKIMSERSTRRPNKPVVVVVVVLVVVVAVVVAKVMVVVAVEVVETPIDLSFHQTNGPHLLITKRSLSLQ